MGGRTIVDSSTTCPETMRLPFSNVRAFASYTIHELYGLDIWPLLIMQHFAGATHVPSLQFIWPSYGSVHRVVHEDLGCNKWKKTLACLLVLPRSYGHPFNSYSIFLWRLVTLIFDLYLETVENKATSTDATLTYQDHRLRKNRCRMSSCE